MYKKIEGRVQSVQLTALKMSKMKEKWLEYRQVYPSLFEDGEIEILVNDFDWAEVRASLQKKTNNMPDHLGVIYEDAFFTILRDPVKFPNGEYGAYLRISSRLDRRNGVATIGEDQNGRIAFIELFRHPIRKLSLELPRGFREVGEGSHESAKREFLEETGQEIKNLSNIGAINPDTGLQITQVDILLGHVERTENPLSVDPLEAISQVIWLTEMEIKQAIKANKIVDGITLSALNLLWNKK